MSTYFQFGSCRGGSARRRCRARRGVFVTLIFGVLSALTMQAGASGRFGWVGHHEDHGGVVYAMTNDSAGNEILTFIRDRKGRLYPVPRATVSTGGAGGSVTAAVDPLGSQNALVYDEAHDLLLAVNAGDDTVTAFNTGPRGLPLRRRAVVSSGGFIPVSLAVSEDLLYVLNAGDTGSVATFEISKHGQLTLLDIFDLDLPPQVMTPPFDQVGAPGQVGVDALGRHLIVTHGGGQEMLVAALDDQGLPVGPIVSTPSPGIVPFAFGVTRYGSTLVAEAGSGSVSAYDPPSSGMPLTVTASAVGTGQAATCWIVVHDAGYAYVANTGSNTLSVYGYTRTGNLTLLDAVAAMADGAPTDMTLADGGGYLYTLNAASGEISGFAVDEETGALKHVETQGGLPASAGIQGIAARDL
jgi:6-phosphogluconolactonase (cycloisomerase 2 family)